MSLPTDYAERVYAGVLGKIIGVYLGRPFEQWSQKSIADKFGEITTYVHDQLGVPLIVTDDDISGTFTFVRALEDEGYDAKLSAEAIGNAWLNYIIPNRSILWWGGVGQSSEHTAFHRLKQGIKAPASGSIDLNGHIVAEQIGAQIFIDGWGLLCPGDPALATDLARRAGSVSHDGEAIHGAQMVAAMIALAFEHGDIHEIIQAALKFIPADCLLRKAIDDVLAWNKTDDHYLETFKKMDEKYGYDVFLGGCHMIPNHALIIHALTYGDGDFDKSMTVVNSCGWDTDCNAANVGSILGVMHGLNAFKTTDWRGPVRDKLFLAAADGGRVISDAVVETDHLVKAAYRMRGLEWVAPKGGARFHFSYPGSTQAFTFGTHVSGRLVLDLSAGERETKTATWLSEDEKKMGGYAINASPTLVSGQTVFGTISYEGELSELEVELFVQVDGSSDVSVGVVTLSTSESQGFEFVVPSVGPNPISAVGLRTSSEQGLLKLDSLGWKGSPKVELVPTTGASWRDQWVNAMDNLDSWHSGGINTCHGSGDGLLIYGSREWTDYTIESKFKIYLATHTGVAVRVQGLRRFVALVVNRDGRAQIIERRDDSVRVLGEIPFAFDFGEDITFKCSVSRNSVTGWVNGVQVSAAAPVSLESGAVGLLVSEGRIKAMGVSIS